MTRVIHTGDTHLGYRQYHSHERQADFLAAFRQVVEDAVADDVDAVVHAGDLFHDRRPSLSDIHGTIAVLRELRAADVPFLAVVGNHERTRGEQWLDLFETLGLATRLGREPVMVGDVALYGLDYVPRSKRDALEYDFAPADAAFAGLVTHGAFAPFVPEVRTDIWDLETVLDASNVEFDAALLGDEHAADTARVGGAWATYCGSTERCDAAERAERGYNIVEFDDEVAVSRRGLETRRFVVLDLELAPGEGIERVRERVREEDVEDAVVVVGVEGDGDAVSPAAVEEYALDRGALIARVTDRREFDREAVPAVEFADPDAAVRERLREMGLSEAALSIDATVRSDDVVHSNVRQRVRERVATLLDEDPGAFTAAGEPAVDEADESDDAAAADGRDADTTADADAEEPAETTADGGQRSMDDY